MKTTEDVLLSEPKELCVPARDATNGSRRRVLRVWVVDDSAARCELFAHLLTKQPGIRCMRQFPSADAILATLAEERPPDMIILDINLGGQSGLAAIRPIKKLAPSVKVLMMTMFSNGHYEAEAFHSGASGFLLKSYGIDDIAELIHEAHCNPGAPGLFPLMAQHKEAELGLKRGPANNRSGGRLDLVGALRRLCRAPRRQTAS